MSTTRIDHAWLIPIEGPEPIVRDAAVAIHGDRIVDIGTTADIVSRHPDPDIVIDATGQAVLPGFVNTHTHLVGALNKGITEDPAGISGGLFRVALPMHEHHVRREDVYWPGIVHGLEMLRTGTTCINETWWFQDESARVIRDLGMRGVIAEMVREMSFDDLGPASLNRRFIPALAQQTLDDAERVIADWHGQADGRITCRVAPFSPDTCSPGLLERCLDLAERHGLGFHVHLSQIPGEDEFMRHTYGQSSVSLMDQMGYLSPAFVGAHCVFVDDADIAALARTGAHMSWTAFLVAKRAYFPPMPDVLDSGIRLSLGTDWCSNDMFKTMRTAILMARHQGHEVGVLDAQRALEMATMGGARALQLDGQIGSLVPGKKADITIVDLQTPWCQPIRPDNVISNLVYNANGSDVSNVLVDGRLIVKDGRVTTVDEREAFAAAQRVAEGVWARASDLLGGSAGRPGA